MIAGRKVEDLISEGAANMFVNAVKQIYYFNLISLSPALVAREEVIIQTVLNEEHLKGKALRLLS